MNRTRETEMWGGFATSVVSEATPHQIDFVNHLKRLLGFFDGRVGVALPVLGAHVTPGYRRAVRIAGLRALRHHHHLLPSLVPCLRKAARRHIYITKVNHYIWGPLACVFGISSGSTRPAGPNGTNVLQDCAAAANRRSAA